LSTLDDMTPDERERIREVLGSEYTLLTNALTAAWSTSLVRTSIFLISLSAAGVALGFVAQDGLDRGPFRTVALVVLPLVLFLGVATFMRLVQVQRESVVYITGLNRIRYFFQESAPGSRPYFVLPSYDDEIAWYRGLGTGMRRGYPRYRMLYLVVQTQGVVGVITAGVAAAGAGLAVAAAGPVAVWVAATVAFAATVIALFIHWRHSLAELRGAIKPINPTPPDEIDAPC
jgi:hypothetical protein